MKPPRPDLVARAIKPDYALGPHVAALGLTFSQGARLGPAFAQGAFVGEPWQLEPRSAERLQGRVRPLLRRSAIRNAGRRAHRLYGHGKAYGRPVGVAIGADGSLLVADDVGNRIWRVTAL